MNKYGLDSKETAELVQVGYLLKGMLADESVEIQDKVNSLVKELTWSVEGHDIGEWTSVAVIIMIANLAKE